MFPEGTRIPTVLRTEEELLLTPLKTSNKNKASITIIIIIRQHT
jgi:hypothetical protein